MSPHSPGLSRVDLRTVGDLALARLAVTGERSAFEELVRRAAPVIRSLLLRMGAQPALADDLAQDTLIAASRCIASFRGESPFAGWTAKIAARLYLKRCRRDARIVLMAELPEPEVMPEYEASLQIERLDLDRALLCLSERERLCVGLCHGAGLTHAEIAEALEIPLGTVKSHVARGLTRLRQFLLEPNLRGNENLR